MLSRLLSFNIPSNNPRVVQSCIEDNKALHCRGQIIHLLGITGPWLSPSLLWAQPGPRTPVGAQDGFPVPALPGCSWASPGGQMVSLGIVAASSTGTAARTEGSRSRGCPGSAALLLLLSNVSGHVWHKEKVVVEHSRVFVSGGSDASC